ncbi:hypothetical protein [Campylobacter geochelonis]|uniref:Transmembrane protein n=1 Tax=Campylobacter geochelonis TaxID=1780362 RepID=A0A128EBK8_9BACT|nr:hypothetical protein [Campylobacter geochelonis]QKF70651.1 putative membrane protein [Campylobacter geochelonis]CZE45857.1 transmembrane protein [Campylobacter geochelonis]
MKKVILIFILVISYLNSATLMNQEVYDNGSSVDIKLLFDSAFNGKIYRSQDDSNLVITLDKTTSNEKFINQLNSKIVSEFSIQNKNDSVEIIVKGSKDLKAEAIPSSDKLSLTIKFTDSSISSIDTTPKEQTQASKEVGGNLSLVFGVVVLFILAVLLFFVVRKFKKPKDDFELSIFDEKFENRQNELENDEKNLDDGLDEFSKLDNLSEENFEANSSTKTAQQDRFRQETLEQDPEYDEIKIVYKDKISDEKDVILLDHNGQKYITFLSKDNQIPQDIFDAMMKDRDKFEQFLEICKKQNNQI